MIESGELSGQVALVTGSSSGIGSAIAQRLAANGASIILHGRSESDHLREVQKSIASTATDNQTVKISVCDFTESHRLAHFADETWDQFGHIDIVINNAGGDVLTGKQSSWSFTQKLEYLLKVDVTATLLLSRIFGQKMVSGQRNGSIINIGWDQAYQGMAGDSGEMFSTTKGAVMSMSLSLAQSLAPLVRVNCVAPGWIQTKWGKETSNEWDSRAKSESLMNRWGQTGDVADAIAFLAGPKSSFVSGQILNVNGGFRYHND